MNLNKTSKILKWYLKKKKKIPNLCCSAVAYFIRCLLLPLVANVFRIFQNMIRYKPPPNVGVAPVLVRNKCLFVFLVAANRFFELPEQTEYFFYFWFLDTVLRAFLLIYSKFEFTVEVKKKNMKCILTPGAIFFAVFVEKTTCSTFWYAVFKVGRLGRVLKFKKRLV